MADLRLKGQEVSIQIIKGGAVVTAINAVADFGDTLKFEKKEQGFLGELTNRYDEIFNGFDVSMTIQVSEQGWMELQQAIKDKAQRKTPGTEFNVVRTDLYPNGQTPTRTYRDVHWGPQPTRVASRGDFVTVGLDFSCSDTEDNLQGII